jgi:hypothetical protein
MGVDKKRNWLREMFSDTGGYVSSKRGLGAFIIAFALVFSFIVFAINKELSGNILTFLLALVTAGTTLLGISILEKK